MSWSLFSVVDRVLLEQEQRQSSASRTPRVWPSEASAELLRPWPNRIVGKCHRASFFRLIGAESTNPVDTVAARRFRTGRAMEADLAELCRLAGIFVASGVRYHVPDINMPLELDLVVLAPDGSLCIVENKTIYGYRAASEVINGGSPKMEHVLQAVIYGNEFRTGRFLKEAVRRCHAEMIELEAAAASLPAGSPEAEEVRERLSRYRLEVDWDRLEQAGDGPVSVKIAYETRDTCETAEFDISIVEEDGEHFACVNGSPVRDFTIRSIYDRYARLQAYYWRARSAAEEKLKQEGLAPEDAASSWFEETADRWQLLVAAMNRLGPEYWPPAEYEWRYADSKIEEMGKARLLSKTLYARWQKDRTIRIGDWQCEYCPYKMRCVPVEYPAYAGMVQSLLREPDES